MIDTIILKKCFKVGCASLDKLENELCEALSMTHLYFKASINNNNSVYPHDDNVDSRRKTYNLQQQEMLIEKNLN